MKNYHKLTAILFALAFTAVFIFAESDSVKNEASRFEYENRLKKVRIKCDDLFFDGESGFSEENGTNFWRGSGSFEDDLIIVHPRMASVTNLVLAKEYLSLVERANYLKGAYILVFWAPEILFQLPDGEVIDYYRAMLEKEIPVPRRIKEKLEEDHYKDPAFWSLKLSKFNHNTHKSTNEVLAVKEILGDFDKAIPKEERKAGEKCIEAEFVYFLEGPEKAADFLLNEIAKEKDPSERQILYVKAASFYYPDQESSRKIIKALVGDKDVPDPLAIFGSCHNASGFGVLDHGLLPHWEKAMRAKDPQTAVEAWLLFDRHFNCMRFCDPDPENSREIPDKVRRFLESYMGSTSKFRPLKDNFLKYLREEAPFKEDDFFNCLFETELKAEHDKKDDYIAETFPGRLTCSLRVMRMFGQTEELNEYARRKIGAWQELEREYSGENGGGENYPWQWQQFWGKYRDEAKLYGFLPFFKKEMLAFIEQNPDFFQIIKAYCEVLINEGKKKEAEEFLRKHYPEEKLLRNPGNLKGYVAHCKWQDIPCDEKALVRKIFDFWLEEDPSALAEKNQYLWERLWTKEYRELRKEVRTKLLALPQKDHYILKRLKELTTDEDYKVIAKAEEGEEQKQEETGSAAVANSGSMPKQDFPDDIKITYDYRKYGLDYPAEVQRRFYDCKRDEDPEASRWAIELALMKGRPSYNDLVLKLPDTWNTNRNLLAFEQSVWYLGRTGMLLPALGFLLDRFYEEKRIPGDRWLQLFNSAKNSMSTETNLFNSSNDNRRFSPDFLERLQNVRSGYLDHKNENAIAAFYITAVRDRVCDSWRYWGEPDDVEKKYKQIYKKYGCNKGSLKYLYAIYVDDRTNKLAKTLGDITGLLWVCEDINNFNIYDLEDVSTQIIRSVELNEATDSYLEIYHRLLRLAEKRRDKEATKIYEQKFRDAFVKDFEAFAKADKDEDVWYYLRDDLKHFKGRNDLTNLISVCGLIRKNRAFNLDIFINFLLDFSNEDLAVLGGAPNFETLSKYFALGDPEEELREVEVSESFYTNVMHKILNAAVARNDTNEVKRITWQLKTYPKFYKERLEREEKEREEREREWERKRDISIWNESPFSTDSQRIRYQKEKLREKELKDELGVPSDDDTVSDDMAEDLFDPASEGWVLMGGEDWDGHRAYMMKKWEKEAEKYKSDEGKTENDGETENTDAIEE